MRFLSPKVLFNLIRQRLSPLLSSLGQRMGFVSRLFGRIRSVLDALRIWRRPKLLVGIVAGILVLGGALVVILPSPEKAPTAAAKVKKIKKVKTAAQLRAEAEKKRAAAEAERKLRMKLLADTKRKLASEEKKMAEAMERKRMAELNRKLRWISRGNGRFWKVTRLGYEGKLPHAADAADKKDETSEKSEKGEKKNALDDLFASNAFPLGADESDGTYTMGDDPEDPASSSDAGTTLPGKDWRKHIWTPKGTPKKKSKKAVTRKPQVIPASFIYATFDTSDKEITELPPAADRVFRRSRILVVPANWFDEKTRESMSTARYVQDFISLTAIIRGNLFGKIERIGVRYRLSSGRLDRMKPWQVAALFSLEPAEGLRRRAGYPQMDVALQMRARKRRLPIVALETPEETVKVHSDFTDPEQISLLTHSLRMNRKVEQYRADMMKAYLAGETAKMREMYKGWVEDHGAVLAEKILPRAIEKRSRRMAANMMAQINMGRAFIAVPAINMSGRSGVLRILTRNGYRVRYVETDTKKPMLVANPKYVNSPFFGDTLDPTPRKKPSAKIAKNKKRGKPKAKAGAGGKPVAKREPVRHPARDPRETQKAASGPE